MTMTSPKDAAAAQVAPARLRLPRFIGTREEVDELFAAQQVPDELHGRDLALLCRDLLVGSPSVADEVVRVAIEERGAGELILVGARPEFMAEVFFAAARRGVAFRVIVRSWAEVAV